MTGIGPRGAAALLSVGLGLTLGVGGPRTASHALSFAQTSTVVAASPSKAAVLVDTGSGRFIRVKRNGSNVALADAIGDLNGDGRPDLVTHYNEDERDSCTESDGVEVCTAYVFVNLHNKNGTFRSRLVYSSDSADVTSSAIGDVNRDGRRDLLLGLEDDVNGESGVLVLLGRGNGKYQRPYRVRTGKPLAVSAADLNGDGAPALVTADYNGTVSVHVNQGGSFASGRTYRVGPDPAALAIGDLNGDGRPDLAVSRAGGGTVHAVTVLLNQGHGSFGHKRDYQTGTEPVSLAPGDVNGDGRPDLVTANNDAATASVLLNEGGGRFGSGLDYATGPLPMAVAIGRYDSDRRRDLVIPTFNGGAGDAVTVLVDTPGLCDVQDVWGKQLAAATQTLALSGCGLGTVAHSPSNGFAAGRIIGQSPEGWSVQHGGAVNLTVSDGPGPGPLAANPSFAAAKSYPTPKGGQQVAVADLNGDGSADVVSANCGNTVSVLLNPGNGTLAARHDYRVSDCPDALSIADLNGDGRPDIVTGDDSGTVSVLLNRGDGTFEARHDYDGGDGPTYGTNYTAVGDLNGDGKPDLAIGQEGGVSILLNNGDGTFGAKRDYLVGGGEAVAIADVNGDGKADLVTDDAFDVTVALNHGDGTFENAQRLRIAEGDASDIFLGDLTGDGKPDVVATDFDYDGADVLLNDGSGRLRPYVGYPAAAGLLWLAIGDVNGDGTQDLVSAGKTVSILRNRGDGTLVPKHDYAYGKRPPHAVALGDLNGDGRLDLVTANGATVVVRLHR
ncbi:MAG TPA: FG-GAP-like repeat-containing protein [Gaiellaceae bacterium]|nr:FG-GAP-like repeat-containing protein [Gaiellaceae bacterium]